MKLNLRDYNTNEIIKIIRENVNKTQIEFAKDLKISRRILQSYEYGTVNYPFEILAKIARTYDLEIIIQSKKK